MIISKDTIAALAVAARIQCTMTPAKSTDAIVQAIMAAVELAEMNLHSERIDACRYAAIRTLALDPNAEQVTSRAQVGPPPRTEAEFDRLVDRWAEILRS